MIDQGELFSIPSPCQGICEVNNRGYCKGCLRNRTERFHWLEFTAYQQQLIINNCEKRRQKIIASRKAINVEEEELEIPQFDLFTPPSASIPAEDKPDLIATSISLAEADMALASVKEKSLEEVEKTVEAKLEKAPLNSLFAESEKVNSSEETIPTGDKKSEKLTNTQHKNTHQLPDSDQLDMFS